MLRHAEGHDTLLRHDLHREERAALLLLPRTKRSRGAASAANVTPLGKSALPVTVAAEVYVPKRALAEFAQAHEVIEAKCALRFQIGKHPTHPAGGALAAVF